jgi:hypothetical protein
MQRPPRESRDECAGRVGEHLRGSAVPSLGVVVAVLERGFAWLAGARGARAEEVERDEDYAWCAEGQGKHGYARKECGGSAGGREGTLAEAIDGESCGEEEGNEGEVVVEHGQKGMKGRMRWVNWLFVRFIGACCL